MERNEIIKSLLLGRGFDAGVIRRMCRTRQSILAREVDHNGRKTSVQSLLTNHYINRQNHWVFRPSYRSDTLVFYMTGDCFDELREADFEISETINNLEYQDYIVKFNPYEPIEIIELSPNFDYKSMPKNPQQDNKKTKVGSGDGYLRDVRFPAKKRGKPTWKRFYDLFPEFTGYKTYAEFVKEKYGK